MTTIPVKRLLKRLVPQKWRRNVRERIVSMNVTHLYGPKSIRLAKNEAGNVRSQKWGVLH